MKTNYPVRNSQQEQFLASMQGWIKAKNAARCQEFAEKIGREKDENGLPALMELLRLPSGFVRRRTNASLCAAREAAVYAIAQIDSPDALACVGIALFNSCAEVRAAASQILNQAGSRASDPLARMMHWKQNWSVEGMRVLLYTLGTTRNANAGPALARVIMGELPLAPPRWSRKASCAVLPLVVVEALVVMWGLIELGIGNWWAVLLAASAGVFFAVMDLAIFLAVRNTVSASERRSLTVAGCEALWMLGDKKALGTLLFNSRRPEADIAAVAHRGVMALLPKLSAEDNETMPLSVRQRLITMLGLPDAHTVLAVLRAMEWVGTGQARVPIQRLMEKGVTEEIRAEAARILPIVATRAEQEKISETLLRASQSPTHAQGELLRAAYASPETASEELLRATSGQGE